MVKETLALQLGRKSQCIRKELAYICASPSKDSGKRDFRVFRPSGFAKSLNVYRRSRHICASLTKDIAEKETLAYLIKALRLCEESKGVRMESSCMRSTESA